MSSAEVLLDLFPDSLYQIRRKLIAFDLQEQEDSFTLVLLSLLTNAYSINDLALCTSLKYGVDLTTAEANTGWVQHSIAPAQDDSSFGLRIESDVISVCPDLSIRTFKVGCSVLLSVWIVQKKKRAC